MTNSGSAVAGGRVDDEFERIARLGCRCLGVPVTLICLRNADGILIPGACGLPTPQDKARLIESSDTLTGRVMATGKPLVVPDIHAEAEIAQIMRQYEPMAGALAVMPIFGPSSEPVGSLIAVAAAPRLWSGDDLISLRDLAASCTDEVEVRSGAQRALLSAQAAEQNERRTQFLLSLSEAFAGASTHVEVERAIRGVVADGLGAAMSDLALVDADRRGLTFVSGGPEISTLFPDTPNPTRQQPARRRVTDDLPICEVYREQMPSYFRSSAEIETRYPLLAGRLTSRGAASLVPIFANDEVIACLFTRWREVRDFDPETAALETTLASYVGVALERIALLEARREASTTLQNALLHTPPDVPGLEIATTYEPAATGDQVGGDWFDVVPVDANTTWLMIGDVCGHDLGAAAAMGQLRSIVRTLAWSHGGTPAEVLALADRANLTLGPNVMATCILAKLTRDDETPDKYHLTWSNAGHPPPVKRLADSTVEVLGLHADLILGVTTDVEREDRETTLESGETLLLYTDGLIERRDTTLQQALDGLLDRLSHAPAGLPKSFMPALMTPGQEDDVAVLAVRTHALAA